jgi:uncharacterized membrane protein
MRLIWLIVIFALVHAAIFMVLYDGAFPGHAEVDSRPLYFSYASKVFDGQLPYQDFDIEYAPLSLPIFLLPRLVANTYSEYHVAFAVEMLVFDLIGLVLIALLTRRLGSAPWKALIAYTLFLLAIGSIVTDHFDIVPAILVLFSLYAFMRGWNIASWAALGLGTMTKVYPIVVVPILALYLLKWRDRRRLVQGVLAFTLTLILIAVPCLIISPSGFYNSFDYHFERGLQIESTYASLVLLGDTWGFNSTKLVFDYGAWEIDGQLADVLAHLASIVMLLALGAVYFRYFRQQRFHYQERDHGLDLVLYATLAILVFLLANKVLSPQYIIWIYPLVPVIALRRRFLLWAIFIMVGLLTMYIFPDNYLDLVAVKPRLVYALVLRNALLVGIAILLWRASNKQSEMPPCT